MSRLSDEKATAMPTTTTTPPARYIITAGSPGSSSLIMGPTIIVAIPKIMMATPVATRPPSMLVLV